MTDSENGTISDLDAFQALTGAGHEIAGLYAFYKMDVLLDLARLVSLDFFARPEFYKGFDDESLTASIARLHARYGCDEFVLDHEQRGAVFEPLFEDSAGDFLKYRNALLSAAATVATWGQPTGIPMLYEAVRTALRPFRIHLTRFAGPALTWSRTRLFTAMTEELGYRILRDGGVSAVFSIRQAPARRWPYAEDAMGEQLVEEISRRLDPGRSPGLTRYGFSLTQRAALRGAEAITAVLDHDPQDRDDAKLHVLITRCYTWWTALVGTTGPATAPVESVEDHRDVRPTAMELFRS
ncbi:hypothetical protein OHB14_61735 [Streptomyces sp. NBC_01613]|uniref:hypothetical protein n=1 Tax=Streptomyces sp. NBC_01613 TaxID=2975896 RepID=UPI0038689888